MLNKAMLVGRLGQDVELKSTKNNTSVANFSVATTESYKKDGDRVEHTEWHNCVVFGKTADFMAKYATKGALVLVEGRIKTESYEDKNGDKKYSTKIYVENVQLLSKPSGEGKSQKSKKDQDDDGDLGFE